MRAAGERPQRKAKSIMLPLHDANEPKLGRYGDLYNGLSVPSSRHGHTHGSMDNQAHDDMTPDQPILGWEPRMKAPAVFHPHGFRWVLPLTTKSRLRPTMTTEWAQKAARSKVCGSEISADRLILH
jgi:hypothetical protein